MDKIDRLLDAIEHPESYSTTEIETLLQDREVKEAFEILDKISSSLQSFTPPDIDKEWQMFEYDHRQSKKAFRHRYFRLISNKVAASVAIGVVSFVAIATIVGVGIYKENKQLETAPGIEEIAASEKEDPVTGSENNMPVEVNGDPIPDIVIFDNETLETIMARIAPYYDCKVIFNNETAKSLRLYFHWHRDLSVEEVVERLNNFEQIHIVVENNAIKID